MPLIILQYTAPRERKTEKLELFRTWVQEGRFVLSKEKGTSGISEHPLGGGSEGT